MDQPQATMEDKVLDIVKSEPLSTEEHDHSEPMDIDTIDTTVTPPESNSSLHMNTENRNDSSVAVPTVDEQHLQDLEAITQLQQMSVAQTQALASAAAALQNSQNFQLFADFNSNALAASVIAAAAANANNNNADTNTEGSSNTMKSDGQLKTSGQQKSQRQQQQQQQNVSQLPTEILKRELMNQKVRADNRERKKRWRQQNEERNKDNDLRCRVNKRAHKLFGKEESEHKKKWIDDEFLKRQQKRKDKERRKGLVDDSLSAHHAIAAATGNTNNGTQNSMDMLNSQIGSQPNIAGLSDVNYLTLLCNNLGIPAAARSLIGSHGLNALTNTTEDAQTEPQSQPQQPQSQSDATPNAANDTTTVDNGDNGDHGDNKDSKVPFPFQLLEILQQLQQYQPQGQGTEAGGTEGNNEFQLSTEQQPFGNNMLGDDARPEEKLAALLTSTLQAANAAAVASTSSNTTIKEEDVQSHTETSDNTIDTTTEATGEQPQQNNAEFPMDAVLTLMQLNAGWRQ